MEHCPNCPTQSIVDPPEYVYENYYHPQIVQVVHPIQVIKQHHCVPVPQHVFTYSEQDVWCNQPEMRGSVARVRGKSATRARK